MCVRVMSWGEGEEERQWSCGKPGSVNLQKMSSIVEPCLSQSPIKVVIAVRFSFQATFIFQKIFKFFCCCFAFSFLHCRIYLTMLMVVSVIESTV